MEVLSCVTMKVSMDFLSIPVLLDGRSVNLIIILVQSIERDKHVNVLDHNSIKNLENLKED